MNYTKEYERWLHSSFLSKAEKDELLNIKDEEMKELCFGASMNFGTAGLRSTMNLGPACMNVYTVAQTTQGIAELIKAENGASRGVAIAYDSRNNSRLFAHAAAEVLAANGIKCYVFDDIRPTPELSFAVRELSCIAGINITINSNKFYIFNQSKEFYYTAN